MNATNEKMAYGSSRWRLLAALGVAAAATLALAQCAMSPAERARHDDGVAAFATVYRVLQHPRCMNCHPVGRVPLQGDDSHPHGQNVQAGDDGKGLFGMRCASCHFEQNGVDPHQPPGTVEWHLPAADMPLVFQGRSMAELAAQLVDRAQNGDRSPDDLLHHVTFDPLVKWGWKPGPGRTPVDVPRDEFLAAMRKWIDAGCPIPE